MKQALSAQANLSLKPTKSRLKQRAVVAGGCGVAGSGGCCTLRELCFHPKLFPWQGRHGSDQRTVRIRAPRAQPVREQTCCRSSAVKPRRTNPKCQPSPEVIRFITYQQLLQGARCSERRAGFEASRWKDGGRFGTTC